MFIVFDGFADFFKGWSQHEGLPLPKDVLITPDGEWVVPESVFGDAARDGGFDRILETVGAKWRRVEKAPAGKTVPVRDAAVSRCRKKAWDMTRLNDSDFEGRLNGAQDLRGREFILAAGTRPKNARLLEVMTGYLINGIRCSPIRYKSSEQSFYLWRLDRQPPLPVLESAEQVWWGPVGGAGNVYEQWPYTLEIPPAIIDEVKGLAPLVLVNREPAQLIFLQAADLPPIERVVDLTVGHANPPVKAFVELGQPPSPNFQVELRLVRQPAETARDRLRENLRRKISLYRGQLEALEDPDDDDDDFVEHAAQRQPLYLYHGSEHRLPQRIQELLLEWSDQPGDLDQVQYVRLEAKSLPECLREDGCDVVHVLTTTAALRCERDPKSTLAARLADYAPWSGAQPRFMLDPEWASVKLPVFLPSDNELALYPAMRPSVGAAEKLATVLVPGASGYPPDCCVILPQAGRQSIESVAIPKAEFRPLVEAYAWKCSANVVPTVPRAVTEKNLVAFEIESVRLVFEEVYREQIDKKHEKCRQDFEERRKELSELRKKLAAIQDGLKAIGEELNTTRTGSVQGNIDDARKASDKLKRVTNKRINHAARFANEAASEIEGMEKELNRFGDDLSKLKVDLASARKVLATSATDEVEAFENEIEAFRNEIEFTNEKTDEVNKQVTAARSQTVKLRGALSQERRAVRRLIRGQKGEVRALKGEKRRLQRRVWAAQALIASIKLYRHVFVTVPSRALGALTRRLK